MALINDPRPPHRRYRGRPRLGFRQSHPTIATRLLVGALMPIALGGDRPPPPRL